MDFPGLFMKSSFLPRLVNDVFSDPVLWVRFRHRRRGLLFDLGAIDALSNRSLLAVSEVFVSHCHMDHFYGFDRLLRVILARTGRLRLFGPPGFIERVGHRLQGYLWNLVGGYSRDQWIEVAEWDGGRLVWARFSLRSGFQPIERWGRVCRDGVLWQEPGFRIRAALLDHGTPVLAFALEEDRHVNVWKARLDELGLPVGHWLRSLKEAVLTEADPETPVEVPLPGGGRHYPLGWLAERVLRVTPGMHLAYVVDCRPSPVNEAAIVELARGADYLFIEAPFLDEEAEMAMEKAHLTARWAGEVARRAGVARVVPVHFSPRHEGEADRVYAELAEAAGPGVRCLVPSSLSQR